MPCSLVKTIDQFEDDGCDNCGAHLQMKGNREMVYDCTSSSFDGINAMMSPEDSWVSKWQRVSNFKPGVYAVSVTGRLPQGNSCDFSSEHLPGPGQASVSQCRGWGGGRIYPCDCLMGLFLFLS